MQDIVEINWTLPGWVLRHGSNGKIPRHFYITSSKEITNLTFYPSEFFQNAFLPDEYFCIVFLSVFCNVWENLPPSRKFLLTAKSPSHKVFKYVTIRVYFLYDVPLIYILFEIHKKGCSGIWLKSKVVHGLRGLPVGLILLRNNPKTTKISQLLRQTKFLWLVISTFPLICSPSAVPLTCCCVGTVVFFSSAFNSYYIHIYI